MQQPQVAFELLVPQGGIEIAAVVDGEVAEADGVSGLLEVGQDLLVNAVVSAEGGVVAEEADLADEGGRAVGGMRTLLQD